MILNYIIPNKLPYIGKIVLKFEKDFEYTLNSNNKRNIYNSTILNLGFTKLVSRLITDLTPDPDKVKLIEEYTGGVVRDYEFDGYVNNNCFMTKSGKFIGNLDIGWMYYNNNLKVCNDYPHGCAEVYEDITSPVLVMKGYYGYTYRAGCIFELNDYIYEENWKPHTYLHVSNKAYEEYSDYISINKIDETKIDTMKLLADFVSPKEHGDISIQTMEQAKESAIKYSESH